MERNQEVVYLVEHDAHVRQAITALLTARGWPVLSFSSAAEFLGARKQDLCACVVVEMDLPDTNGLDLQRRLSAEANPPIIFVSHHSSVSVTVSAMKAGAIEFFTLPVEGTALAGAVQTALAQDRRNRKRQAVRARLRERLGSLTPRQREVLPLVVGGLLNKEAAAILEISEVTLQIHRSQIMRKMAAASFADLVRMAVALHIPHWRGFPAP